MPTTIESLELEVQSNSTSAISGIDALSASLSKLKNAVKGGVGLTSVTNQLKGLNAALSGIDGSSAGKLDMLSNSLSKLSALGNIKISSSIGNQLKNIGTAATSLNGVDFSGIGKLSTALQPLASLGKSNLASFITQLSKLPQLAQTLQGINIAQFTSQIQQLANALAPLASQLNTVATSFSRLPANIRNTVSATNTIARANDTAATSYINLWAKCRMAMNAVRIGARVLASFITESNSYIENLNLFTASMGEYAAEAQKYAEAVGEAMGIDPGQWMRNQGVFMTITEGFGVASDRAYTMSKNLTQLGYDLSSFFNISFEDSMQKLQSGISGELEPLRRLGYDLSQARLQQEALNLGIDKSISKMTQAEKAQIRYYSIMTQVTVAQGDMARTLNAPANQLRVLTAQVTQCARALGNIFIPALNAILPYVIAFVKIIRMAANAIASLFGFELPEIDYSGISGGSSAAGDLADGLGDATKKAKKLKNALFGIDELNVLSPNNDSSDGGSGGLVGGGDLGFELPDNGNWLDKAINEQVDEIMKKLEPFLTWVKDNINEILAGVMAIGAAFLAWKIAKGVIKALEWLSTLKGFSSMFSIGFKIAGLGLFLDAWNTMKEAIQDIMENGANFTNVTKLISGFAEGLGAAFLLFGNIKLAGASLIISGIAGIVSDISDMMNNGVNWENAISLIKNIGLFVAGIGLTFGNLQLGGIGLMISGVSLIVQNFHALVTGFTTGDWGDVNWIETVSGVLMLVGGLILAFKTVNKIADVATIGKTTETIRAVTDTTSTLDTTISTGLSPKLTSLAKNLGLGLVIVAEVAAAALLITGAIILLGKELEQVGIAWSPVIENGETIAIAMGLGIALLAGIGVVTALLGSVGTPLIVNIALGTAILAELGIATGLFLIEIWAIGKGLDEIGKAWKPVLDNGETIATGIGLGTALLVGIGVVTALLGVATVASAGLLPLAIGLGTALLVELAVATVLFIESLVAVAKELGNNLAPVLDDLNGKLPGLTTNMSDFVDFMCAFAGEVVRYTGASAVAGLSATIDTIIGWFTQDPIKKMTNDVGKIAGQAKELNDKLNLAIPELKTATDLLGEYVDFMDKLGTVAGSGGTVNLSEGLKVNLKTVGQNIVTGFNEGIKSKYSTIQSTITAWGKDVQTWFTSSSYGSVNKEKFATYANDIMNGFNTKITSSSSGSKSSIISWASNVKSWFTSSSYGGVNRETFGEYAKNVVDGFKNGIVSQSESGKSGMTTWANNTKKYFADIVSYSTFYDIAKDVIKGFNNGINDFYDTTRPYMRRWANDAKEAFKDALDSNSPSKVFERIGGDTVLGYNIGVEKLGYTTKGLINKWTDSFTNISPRLAMAVDTSAVESFDPSKVYGRALSAEVSGNYQMTADGFVEGMEEFYREYLEPTLNRMANDVKRQADKEEQTLVQVGNRVVTDAVVTQQKANGYKFVTT